MSDPFAEVLAQDAAVDVLRRALAADRLASAYLFMGPSGVGKERTALALAAATLGSEHAARIAADNHPDVRRFRPRDDGHRNLKVETLRKEVLPYAEFAPFEGPHAFVIFPEADVSFPEAHPGSANALLKTLEEPRQKVTFVLLAERPDRLLPTIRSRCQPLRFRRLHREALLRILADAGVPDDVGLVAAALAGGRADLALRLAEDDRAADLLALALKVDAALAERRPGLLVDVADTLAKAPDRALTLDALALFYRDLASVGLGRPRDTLHFAHAAETLEARAATVPPGVAAARVGLLSLVRGDLEANASPGVAMDALLHRLRTARP
ncbi:MAG: AAA family ATPase [Myxococcota bacterium]